MEINIYTLFILSFIGVSVFLALTTSITIGAVNFRMAALEKTRREDDERMSSFMRYAHVESQKSRKEAARILAEIQQTNRELKQINKDNSIYLHRIFEIVDDPEDNSREAKS